MSSTPLNNHYCDDNMTGFKQCSLIIHKTLCVIPRSKVINKSKTALVRTAAGKLVLVK